MPTWQDPVKDVNHRYHVEMLQVVLQVEQTFDNAIHCR